jgi:hypothetical protein
MTIKQVLRTGKQEKYIGLVKNVGSDVLIRLRTSVFLIYLIRLRMADILNVMLLAHGASAGCHMTRS